MATLYTHQSENIAKTWLLMGAFLILVIAIGWALSYWFGEPMILYVAIAFSLIMNFVSYWKSDSIALSRTGAVPADEAHYRELHRIVENLSITAGLPKPRVYIIQDSVPNAFATGRNPEHSAVAVTTGLLQMLDKSELEGVIAHELAHIGNRDILVMSVAVVLSGFIAMAADFFLRGLLWGGGDNDRDARVAIIGLVVGIVIAIISTLFAQLLHLAVSRKREFLADASGALLTRYPEGLAHALQKISSHSVAMQKAHTDTAHLFIVTPFGPQNEKKSWFRRLWATHPPVEDRINALLGLRETPENRA